MSDEQSIERARREALAVLGLYESEDDVRRETLRAISKRLARIESQLSTILRELERIEKARPRDGN